ncbi:MAG: DUF1538 domain-containing protein [Chloroflexi bacterium]|nr:DUF1538 domain-containing protein [Chloroflexota bacterium]
MNILTEKIKESLLAILPIAVIVLVLHFVLTPLPNVLFIRFLIGTTIMIIGLTIFLFGAEIGVVPLGESLGSGLVRKRKLWLMIAAGLLLGFFITIAEPDLSVLASQVSTVTSNAITKLELLVIVSGGVGILLAVALLRIVFNISLAKLFAVLYLLGLGLAVFSSPDYLAIAFDSSGATTGSMSVPFILALGAGVSSVRGGRTVEEDSFGLAGLSSSGPVLTVLAISLLTGSRELHGHLEVAAAANLGIVESYSQALAQVSMEVALTLLPIVVILLVSQFTLLHLTRRQFSQIVKGLIYTYIGLVMFLTGVHAGFLHTGITIGYLLGGLEYRWVVLPIGMLVGITIVSAEPAVNVLCEQVETVTGGAVRRRIILVALAAGVGVAVVFSMARILVPAIQLWMLVFPVLLSAIVLSFFVPPLFVGIAYDSGGIASGPMTGTFILALTQGVAQRVETANVLTDAFGVVAACSLAPIVSIMIVGVIYRSKARKRGLDVEGASAADAPSYTPDQ